VIRPTRRRRECERGEVVEEGSDAM